MAPGGAQSVRRGLAAHATARAFRRGNLDCLIPSRCTALTYDKGAEAILASRYWLSFGHHHKASFEVAPFGWHHFSQPTCPSALYCWCPWESTPAEKGQLERQAFRAPDQGRESSFCCLSSGQGLVQKVILLLRHRHMMGSRHLPVLRRRKHALVIKHRSKAPQPFQKRSGNNML
jgi:hypothetical protein